MTIGNLSLQGTSDGVRHTVRIPQSGDVLTGLAFPDGASYIELHVGKRYLGRIPDAQPDVMLHPFHDKTYGVNGFPMSITQFDPLMVSFISSRSEVDVAYNSKPLSIEERMSTHRMIVGGEEIDVSMGMSLGE